MDLRDIEAFVAVAEELHFGRAAARLHMAQPPLSQRIRHLERELGTQLFRRTSREVVLTESGAAILDPARQVLEDVDLVARTAQWGGHGEFGRVGIGFSGAASHQHLPRLTQAIRREHPGMRLVLSRRDYANDALAGVQHGELDLAFSRLPIAAEGLSHRVIEVERLVVALSAEHPLLAREEIALSELAGEPFVTFPGAVGSAVRDALVHACLESGFRPQVVQEAPDTHTILALVSAGVGITLLPSSVQHVTSTGFSYRPLAGPAPVLHSVLVWRSNNHSPALQRVLEIAEHVLPTPRGDAGEREDEPR